MHTLFVREHNRLADEIAAANPTFTDEEIFCEARLWLSAIIQSVTYNEFLPAVLGPDAIPEYSGYDSSVVANVVNEFSAAAFRVGHTMLPPVLLRLDESLEEIPEGHIDLAAAFFVPSVVSSIGIEPYLRGLAENPQQATDNLVVDGVRNFLFGQPGSGGFDLATLNIQRGREHGIDSYNAVRLALGLSEKTTFAKITADEDLQDRLSTAYDDTINDIDLWIGGLAEDNVEDSILGETFFTFWVDQFVRLRDGDPHYYLNQDSDSNRTPFSDEEIAIIEGTTLADVIERNTSIVFDRESVFTLTPPCVQEFAFDPSNKEASMSWTSYLNAGYEIWASDDLETPFELIEEEIGEDEVTTLTFTDNGATDKRFYYVIQK